MNRESQSRASPINNNKGHSHFKRKAGSAASSAIPSSLHTKANFRNQYSYSSIFKLSTVVLSVLGRYALAVTLKISPFTEKLKIM
jgi:hypothetical protein